MKTPAAYPLAWPKGRPRTPPEKRKAGKFSVGVNHGGYRSAAPLTLSASIKRLVDEIDRLGGELVVLSTNVEPRLDGLPKSGQRAPADPGVAVYFTLLGKPHCMPCDRYWLVEHNIAAVAAHIEATRAIERHGVASVAEMFTGFLALPPPADHWKTLGLQPGAGTETINAAYRARVTRAHPDTGGSDAAMTELNAARYAALKEIAGHAD